MTGLNQKRVKRIKVEFVEAVATSFGGLSLVERFALRLGFWGSLEKVLPDRSGYSWLAIVKSAVSGLLTGSRGTYATEVLRHDGGALGLLGLAGAPRAGVWSRGADGAFAERLGG